MLMSRKKVSFSACVAMIIFPLAVQAEPADGSLQHNGTRSSVRTNPNHIAPLTLEDAVSVALAGNPGLAKIAARARALAEVPSQVGTLPDPTLSLNALNLPTDTFSLSQEPMTQMQLGIGFTLPFPGKLDLRAQAADFAADAAAFDVDEMRLVLIKNVRSSWWDLYFLDQALSIVKHNQDLLRDLVRVAEAKYRAGQGIQSDVLLAQLELSKLLDIEISLQTSRRRQAAALNALLGRPADVRVPLPKQVDESSRLSLDFRRLSEIGLDYRPALSSQRKGVEAARVRVALAEKDYYPDFKLGAAYGFRSGNNADGSSRPNFASAMFSMNLPIFTGTRQDPALAQRKAEVLKERYDLDDRIVQMRADIEQAMADYHGSREQLSLLKTGIIPQARQTASSMLSGYQVSTVDFLNLVRSQVAVYNYETQYWKALTSSMQALARLEAAVGTTLAKSPQDNGAGAAGKETINE